MTPPPSYTAIAVSIGLRGGNIIPFGTFSVVVFYRQKIDTDLYTFRIALYFHYREINSLYKVSKYAFL